MKKIKSTLHRYKNGYKFWAIKGSFVYHRENGPAAEYPNGAKYWYFNGKLHRDGGPAIDYQNYQSWFQHGLCHREDGPAILNGKYYRRYCLNGKMISKQEHHKLVKMKAFW